MRRRSMEHDRAGHVERELILMPNPGENRDVAEPYRIPTTLWVWVESRQRGCSNI